jgi:hypothetical protein
LKNAKCKMQIDRGGVLLDAAWAGEIENTPPEGGTPNKTPPEGGTPNAVLWALWGALKMPGRKNIAKRGL